VGAAALSGVTAGYLLGFLVAAGLIGEMAQRRREWSFLQIAAVMAAGAGAILLLGSMWLSLLLGIGLVEAVLLGALPFLAVDALKVLIASTVAYALTPRGRAQGY
jgi:biotin transport system substrate-specific component